ncbi:MAG: PASTA domain-containing protein [Coriobacteriia bacterium]|nr:PASTA domain-containing protein [Coriobacteriia bacterium]
MRLRSIALVVVLLAAALVAGCGTAVPDVKGMTAAQATEALSATGFKAGKVEYDPAGAGAKGAVFAQDPAAGQRVSAGAVVNLTVAGPAPVAVPALTGMTRDGAASALAVVGLTAGAVTESYDAAAAGTVISQVPAAGSVGAVGDTVAFAVSRGPKPSGSGSAGTDDSTDKPPAISKVKVPALKSLKLAAAQAKLASVGLKYKHVLGAGDGMADVGFVYKQVPVAGTVVAKGTVVTVYSWKGP